MMLTDKAQGDGEVKIVNKDKLLANAERITDRRAREIVLDFLEFALREADPKSLLVGKLRIEDDFLLVDSSRFDLNAFRRVIVIGAGKASGAMAEMLERTLKDRIKKGCIIVPRGQGKKYETKIISLREATHPIPSNEGVEGSRTIINLVKDLAEEDLVLALISGGASALMPLPVRGVTLQEKQKVTDLLLKSGANISEINAVRKHISEIKGGLLAKAAFPATVISLIISDVVGDPLHVIGSGPTVPDESTFTLAKSVLEKYGIWNEVPNSIRNHVNAGIRGAVPETPKPSDEVFEKTFTAIIGSNRLVIQSIVDKARESGLNALSLGSFIEGEARHVGNFLAGIGLQVKRFDIPVCRPALVACGGETTVTVLGSGRGGRNQELVLSAAEKISGSEGVAIASIGSDGLDGPTDAAGAIADGDTVRKAESKGCDPSTYLKNNDSYNLFKEIGDLIVTGPTGTNVNDVMVMVIV